MTGSDSLEKIAGAVLEVLTAAAVQTAAPAALQQSQTTAAVAAAANELSVDCTHDVV